MRMGLAGVLFKNFWSSCGAFGACCGFSLWPSDMGLYSPVETNSDCRNRSGLRQRLPLTMRRIKYSVVQEHYSRQVLVVLGAGYLLSYQGIRMIRLARASLTLAFFLAMAGHPACGQSPSGPVAPKPGVEVQLPPKDTQAKVRVRVALVNTPVTVRNGRGEMVHDLEAENFKVTDNGVAQQISHFDLGGEPISMGMLYETSSRIEPLLPQIRKTGILFTQTVMGPTGEAAVVSFNDAVDKLQDFTTHGDLIENTITHLVAGTSASKLYVAMAFCVEMFSGRPQTVSIKPA